MSLFFICCGVSAAAEPPLAPLAGFGLDSRLSTERNVTVLSNHHQWMFSTVDDFGAWRGWVGSYNAAVFGKPAAPPDEIVLEYPFPLARERIEEAFGLDPHSAKPGNSCDPTACDVTFYGCDSDHCHTQVSIDYPRSQASNEPEFVGSTLVMWSAEGFDPRPGPWFLSPLRPLFARGADLPGS